MNMKWYYGPGPDPEHFYGVYDTKEQAIAAAKGEWPGECFTIVEAENGDVSYDLFDFDHILERLDEVNEERWGEDGMPDVAATGEQRRELETTLEKATEAFFKKHKLSPKAYMFSTVRNQETFNDDE